MTILNKRFFLYLLISILFFKISFASVDLQIIKQKQLSFDYHKACSEMTHRKNFLIIKPSKIDILDCMGQSLNIIKFCEKKISKNFTRAFMNGKIICESASQVKLSIDCTKQYTNYCQNPKKKCFVLKQIYAKTLVLNYFTATDHKLTCLYQAPLKIKML